MTVNLKYMYSGFFLVGNAQLRGKNDRDASLVLQWINFGDNEILPASCTWVYPCLGITQYNKQVRETVYFLYKMFVLY
jgi:hypothetical protein